MKKWVAILLAALVLVSCTKDENNKNKPNSTEAVQLENTSTEQLNEKHTSNELKQIIVPIEQFEQMTTDEIEQTLQQDGATNIQIRNQSVTYDIQEAQYNENISAMEQKINDMLAQINDPLSYTSVKSMTANETFTTFKVAVNREAFESSFDSLAVFSVMAAVTYYYNFQGMTNYNVEVQYMDVATNEVYSVETYPQNN
jgi:uncharacterized lipoprotein YmbA